jgi:galactosylceramidase
MNRQQFLKNVATVGVSTLITPYKIPYSHGKNESNTEVKKISLSADDKGRIFEGIGAVSAGASSRNLIDYPKKERSEVLDFLFKPKFGAGFQHLKVEIGSGENSTCGSEPSHAITREEILDPKPRGYEFWLMSEARKRNPEIILDCLPWAYPRCVGSRFSQRSAEWFVAFLEVARKHYGLEMNWVSAAQNEMGTDLRWIANHLRPTLDAHGFSKVKIQAPDDNSDYWQIFDKLEKNSKFNNLIDAVGYHYLNGREPWKIDQKGHPATAQAKQSGKPLWASEEWSQSGQEWGGKGALYLARLMNKLYTRDKVTKFEIWCPFDGIYDQIIWPNTGALQADSPWDGHYTVWPAVWALAHTTQFVEPNWVYMDSACGQFDPNTWRSSHVAMRNPKTDDWSVVIVTGEKQKIKLDIGSGLKAGPVYVWKSTQKNQFIKQKPLQLNGKSVEIELESEAIYTLTSTTGQTKGSFGSPPKSKPFPFPYT